MGKMRKEISQVNFGGKMKAKKKSPTRPSCIIADRANEDKKNDTIKTTLTQSHGGIKHLQPAKHIRNLCKSMPLSSLIDLVIETTYHQLSVLSELLPYKNNMDKKIAISDFAARSRLSFMRLATVVRCAKALTRDERSLNVHSYTLNNNLAIVDTADFLARLSRDFLVGARLPFYHVPVAVEVLTSGSFKRLPACIRERIIPPDLVTPKEKQITLLRLNQVIQDRLVTNKLPDQMRDFSITNGCVMFSVKYEFNVTLTLNDDESETPWRLLEIEILVEDIVIGEGQPLVHSMQVQCMQKLLQARLKANENPMHEIYNMLHYFCQSLQLELLHSQTLRLNLDSTNDNIRIEEYIVGVKLKVSYWCEVAKQNPKNGLVYRLTVEADRNKNGRPLALVHIPSLSPKETQDITDSAIGSDIISMEKLLMHTVYIRSVSRLSDLRTQLQVFLPDCDFTLEGSPAILTVPVLKPCLSAEQIHITIDTYSGLIRCHVPKHLNCQIMQQMENSLNNDFSNLSEIISQLRFWIAHRRCEQTLKHLPASATDFLPPLLTPSSYSLLRPGLHKMFVKLHHHSNVVLIIEFKERVNKPNEMDYIFYLAFINFVSHKTKNEKKKKNTSQIEDNLAKPFIEIVRLIELYTFVNFYTDIDEILLKLWVDMLPPPNQLNMVYPAYFISGLAHAVVLCDYIILNFITRYLEP